VKPTSILVAAVTLAAATGANAQDITGDAAAGQKVFNKCKACHVVDEEKNRVGPHLVHIIGREIAAVDGFKYSKAMAEFGADGNVWDVPTLSEYLAAPRKLIKGTKMAFAGLKKEEDIANVIAYINENGGAPADGDS
jgi:cytochrome c